MRRFIVVGHEAPTEAGIDLDDLPGSAGRMDVLARCVTAGLLHSHGIRPDSEVATVLQDSVTIRFDGGSIRQLRPDERSTAARFDQALADVRDAVGLVEVDSAPGVTVSRHDLSALLDAVDTPIVQLHPDGIPVTEWASADDVSFVLSDHRPFRPEENELLSQVADDRVSIGPVAVHADQAIAIVHNYLDTEGYRAYTGPESL